MDDIDIILFMHALQEDEIRQEDLILAIRKGESLGLDEFNARFDDDFSGRLIAMAEKGLLTRRFIGGAYRYKLTPKAAKLIEKEIS